MDWYDALNGLIRESQRNAPTDRDGAAMLVLAKLRDALALGREHELADHCLKFRPTPTNHERIAS